MQPDQNNKVTVLEILLLVLLFIDPVWPRFAMIYIPGMPYINLTRVITIVLLYVWVLYLLGFKEKYRNDLSLKLNNSRNIIATFLIYFAFRIASIFTSDDLNSSAFAVSNEFVNTLIVYIICLTTWKCNRQINRALVAMIVSCSVVSALGIYEYFKGENLFAESIDIINYDLAKAVSHVYRGGYRIKSTFSNPLVLAEYLSFIMPLNILFVIRMKRFTGKILSVIGMALTATALYLTKSRGAMIVLFVMLGLAFLIWITKRTSNNERKKYYGGTIATAFVLFYFFTIPLLFKIAEGSSEQEIESSIGRIEQIKIGVALIRDKPITGYGPKQGRYKIGEEFTRETIDNFYLNIAIESGLPALLLFIIIYILFIRRGIRIASILEADDKLLTYTIIIAACGLLTFMFVLSSIRVYHMNIILFSIFSVYEVNLRTNAKQLKSA